MIVGDVNKLNKKTVTEARKLRAERLAKEQQEAELALGNKQKLDEFLVPHTKIPVTDVVFRVMTWEHIPIDDVKQRKADAKAQEEYDANEDNFSEIPEIRNTSLGTNIFILPKENQKLECNISYIDEYRYGGEMIYGIPAFLAQQSEERLHNVAMASADYQINFNNDNSSLIAYLAGQKTKRKHYTGIAPDAGTPEYDVFLKNPPYGTSDVSTFNIGVQFNHKISDFLGGTNVFTIGSEYLYDDVNDDIPAYNYLIDQTTSDYALFLQSDWSITPNLTMLSGVRMDRHNLLNQAVFSPRVSLLYKYKENSQIRFSYGTGFRAPQAFDADLHIAFAGGGVSRVSLSPNLHQEKSQSISASLNYDKPMENWIIGYTFEGFYTRLNDAFYLQPMGQDQFGNVFEKQNGDGATVQGLTLELRANYRGKLQLESGLTFQTSRFDSSVSYIDGLAGIRAFTRTPNEYGYAIFTFSPTKRWNLSINYIYTGSMKVVHFSGASNQQMNEIIDTDPFSDLSAKVGFNIPIQAMGTNIEFNGGIKNIFNAYQNDFDLGKNRDSNYIYGPSQPRTFFIGFKINSL
jgi:outer membrane receptor for ferrienterochelin and colicins